MDEVKQQRAEMNLSLRVAIRMAGVNRPVKIKKDGTILIGYTEQLDVIKLLNEIPEAAGPYTLKKTEREYSLVFDNDKTPIVLMPASRLYAAVNAATCDYE